MKKILTYYELINEELLIKNKKLVKSYAKEIENEVLKAINSNDLKFIYSTENFDDSDIVLNICNLKEGEIKYVEKIAKKWQNRLIENNISISHGVDKSERLDWKIVYNLIFRNIKTQRVKPKKYIYHFTETEESKNNILKFGLIPKTGVNWKNIDYPNAIFAIDDESEIWNGRYVFRIDTTNLKNKWWYDLNFPIGSKLIMTFEPIGPEHLELLDFKEEINRRRKLKQIKFEKKLAIDLLKMGDLSHEEIAEIVEVSVEFINDLAKSEGL
jgi:hypothetical protein